MQDFISRGFGFYRGRVGLAAILRALGVGAGDEVAIQAFTCIAVPEAVLALGASPVYVDMTPGRFTTDPVDLERKITDGTRAIVIQHTYGIPADISSLTEIADRHGIPLIEDCCHTVATSINGKLLGSFGVAGFYSFEAGKPIIAGLGGWVTVNEPSLERVLRDIHSKMATPSSTRQLQIWGMYSAVRYLYRPATFWHLRKLHRTLSRFGLSLGNFDHDRKLEQNLDQLPEESGKGGAWATFDYDLKLGETQFKAVKRQLKGLADQSWHRKEITKIYREEILSNRFQHPILPRKSDPVLVRYPLMHEDKDRLLSLAQENGIELSDNFSSPVHPLARDDWPSVGYQDGSCCNAQFAAERTFALPTHASVAPKEARRIIRFLEKFS